MWVYDVLMLGEIGFALLNTRWMYPGRTNHLFCCVRVPSSVPCQLCWLSDQSSLWGAGSPCNFILATISANMLPAPSPRLFQEPNVLPGKKSERDFENVITLYPGWQKGGDLSKALKLHTFSQLIYGVDYIEVFSTIWQSNMIYERCLSHRVITLK